MNKPKRITPDQLSILVEHGPYTLSKDGIVHDRNGISLAFSFRTNPGAEECEWDRAVVAALNDVWASNQGRDAG